MKTLVLVAVLVMTLLASPLTTPSSAAAKLPPDADMTLFESNVAGVVKSLLLPVHPCSNKSAIEVWQVAIVSVNPPLTILAGKLGEDGVTRYEKTTMFYIKLASAAEIKSVVPTGTRNPLPRWQYRTAESACIQRKDGKFHESLFLSGLRPAPPGE